MTFNGTSLTLANDASIHGLTVGQGGGSVSSNTAVGASALGTNSSGTFNTAVGNTASYSNTTGQQNAVFGDNAFYTNTQGSYNSAFGRGSLNANTTGANNTALGYFALVSNTTASNNTAVGYQSLQANITGAYQVALGYRSGYNATAGYSVYIGQGAGYSHSTSSENNGSVFIGNGAGGIAGGLTGHDNTYIGANSGSAMTSGSKNTILGQYTGNQGGLDIRTASNYIVLSDGDGNPRGIFDNSGNFLVGSTVSSDYSGVGFKVFPSYGGSGGPEVACVSSTSATGYGTWYMYSTADSQYKFYVNYAGTVFARSTSITGLSDISEKENIRPLETGLLEVMQLQPRRFDWKKGGGSNVAGFVAQEVEAVLPDLVEQYKSGSEDTKLGLKMGDMLPTLVKAIQELNTLVTTQAQTITTMQSTITALQAKVGA
jgi:hypothetical protein